MVFCNMATASMTEGLESCHNPYFNRWFSAIGIQMGLKTSINKVTILILIDGFLQSSKRINYNNKNYSHNPYFNRWFSAIKNG